MGRRNLNLLLGSQLFSVLGTGMIGFACALYVLDLTKSSVIFSVIASLSIAGKVLCLPICGVLADRLPKKSLLLAMDISYAILTVGLAITSQLSQPLVGMGIILIVLGLISAFETPVVQSALPLMCQKEEIPQANGSVSSIGIIGNIVAPIIGAMVYDFNAIYKVFFVSIMFYSLAIFCETMLKLERRNATIYYGNVFDVLKHDMREIFNYLNKKPTVIKVCFLAFLLNFMITGFAQVLVPYLARVQMGISNKEYGFMTMMFAFGGLVGAVIYSVLGKWMVKYSLATLLNCVACLILFLTIPYYFITNNQISFFVMIILIASVYALVTIISIQLIVYIQVVTEQALLGRVMSFVMIISTMAIPIGQIIYGAIGSYLNPATTALLCLVIGILTLVVSVLGKETFKQVQDISTKI